MTTINDVLNYQIADRMPLFYLWRSVWRWLYDSKNCPFFFYKEIEKEILKWHSVVTYQEKIRTEKYGPEALGKGSVGQKGNFVDEIRFQIELMSAVLIYKETGVWNHEQYKPFSPATVERHKLDYHKLPMCVQFFPEFVDKNAKKRGQEVLKRNMEDNPEEYK